MQPDRVLLQVARKELQLFFASPVAWLFLASFMVVSLFTFFWVEAFFARNISDVRPLFEWMPLLLIFLSAALTMRSWSEERRSGTLEHVLTLPVPLWQFVIGKFLACAAVLCLALVATLPLPFTVASIADLDWGPVLAAYLAALLLGSAYLAVGLFVSSRTDNAIVSLMGSVALCGLLYFAGSDLLVGFFGGGAADVLRLLGSGSRFESITRGVIDLRDLYYYLAITVAFLVFNVYALERGRWAAGANGRHRAWQLATGLLIANLVIAGLWLVS
jgi:ABC-2 type transport system permease protein